MTEITDAIRAGVLGAISRGMTLDYAARADGIRVTEAEAIARAAGWPDDPLAVLAEYRRLTGVPAKGKPVQDLIGPAGVDTRRAKAQPLQQAPRRPGGPRLDLSVARVRAEGLRIEQQAEVRRVGNEVELVELVEELTEYFADVDEVIDAITPAQTEQALAKMLDGVRTNRLGAELPDCAKSGLELEQAEREYRGEVVQTGPTPEHREPLESYVARVVLPGGIPLIVDLGVPPGLALLKDGSEVVATIVVDAEATEPPETCEHGYTEGHCDQFGCDPLCSHGCADGDCPDTGCPFTHQSPATAGPLPPATDSPARASVKRSATRPGTLPCEACGVGVSLAYIERTGTQRHGHCREGS